MRGSRFSLVARVLTSKKVYSDGFVGVFDNLWHGGDGVSIKKIDERKFLIRFASRQDMLRVLDMEPWSYKELLCGSVLEVDHAEGEECRAVLACLHLFGCAAITYAWTRGKRGLERAKILTLCTERVF
ncbi:unnamed protein product [Prunus brigantina]